MSKIVKKLKNAVGGGSSNKAQRESLIENDEFLFKRPEKCLIKQKAIEVVAADDIPIYNEYDYLERVKTQPTLKAKRELKDSTNLNYGRRFKEFFQSKSTDKSEETLIGDVKRENETSGKKCSCAANEPYYCEIQDFPSLFSDNHPLIELKRDPMSLTKSNISDSKVNLFINKESEEQEDLGCDENRLEFKTNLTDLRALESFQSRSEAIGWYLSLLHDHMVECVNLQSSLKPNEKEKRNHVIAAHLLYSRNYYEMKTRAGTMSVEAKSRLDCVHPCVVALACLHDSDAVRVVDAHTCACDTYLYLFSTRVKFCAWKTKLFVILKRPKRSSFERLNLIEDLMNCRKILQ